MVRNAVLSMLAALVAGERAAVFPFMAPQNMKVKHELQEGAGFHKYQHYCYNFIYAAVGKGETEDLQRLPSVVGPLCRASKEMCASLTDSLQAAVEQKKLNIPGKRPYAEWCEHVYNEQHPTATHTTTAMPMNHNNLFKIRHRKAEKPKAVKSTTATTTAAAPKVLKHAKAEAQPKTTTAAPLQVAKVQATKKAQLKEKIYAAQKRLQATSTIVAATTPAPKAATTTAAEVSQQPENNLIKKEIKDAAGDVGHFQDHLIADIAGHAIATKAEEAAAGKGQEMSGAETALDRAFGAVTKLRGTEPEHSHRHHRKH